MASKSCGNCNNPHVEPEYCGDCQTNNFSHFSNTGTDPGGEVFDTLKMSRTMLEMLVERSKGSVINNILVECLVVEHFMIHDDECPPSIRKDDVMVEFVVELILDEWMDIGLIEKIIGGYVLKKEVFGQKPFGEWVIKSIEL